MRPAKKSLNIVAGRMSGMRPSSTSIRSARRPCWPGASPNTTRRSSASSMRPPWLNTSPCQDQLPVMVQSKNIPFTFSPLPWMARASCATPCQLVGRLSGLPPARRTSSAL